MIVAVNFFRQFLTFVLYSGIILIFTHRPQPATHNSQPTTHNPQPTTHNASPQPTSHNPQLTFGIIQSLASDSLLHANGYAYMEESVQSILSPLKVDHQQFLERLTRIRSARCRVVACNLFVPAELKLVGPSVDEQQVLAYADSVFHRAREAGIGIIVLGSGGARRVPPGFDSAAARGQFIALMKKMAPLAAAQGVVVAMENLNRGETNFGISLLDILALVKAVDHPSFRVTADIYHMLKEDEPASSILAAGIFLVHGHIAEERDRARPGKYGEDFTPYLKALKQIGFRGKIMMECNWTNLAAEAEEALRYLESEL